MINDETGDKCLEKEITNIKVVSKNRRNNEQKTIHDTAEQGYKQCAN
jgi:hypothetical protein